MNDATYNNLIYFSNSRLQRTMVAGNGSSDGWKSLKAEAAG